MEVYKNSHQNYIARLCGVASIDISDSFWLELLRTVVKLSSVDADSFQDFLRPFCEQLAKNNRTTSHFEILSTHVRDHVESSKKVNATANELLNATNAVVLHRGISSEMIRLIPPSLQSQCLLTPWERDVGSKTLHPSSACSRLLQTCIDYVEAQHVNQNTHALYYAVLTFLLVSFSSQLYHLDAGGPCYHHSSSDLLLPMVSAFSVFAGDHLYAKLLQNESSGFGNLISKLFNNILEHDATGTQARPHAMVPKSGKTHLTNWGFLAAARAATDIVTAPTRALSGMFVSSHQHGHISVSDVSLSLLLIMIFQDGGHGQGKAYNFQAEFEVRVTH